VGLFRLIIIVVLGYIAYRVVRSFILKKELPPIQPKGAIDEMVQDPQCKVYVPMRQAERRIVGGKTYYFCSASCADEFEKKNNQEG
jgi:YHS domain-containing protein